MKKLFSFVALGCAAALIWGFYTLFGGQIANAFNTRAAEQAVEAGDKLRAAGLYARVLERTPRNEALRLTVSGLYRDVGNMSRAEFILFAGLRDVGPSAALYKSLSALYTEQDKLYDAVKLLDEIRSPGVAAEIESLRPRPPVFTPSGGRYEERIGVDLTADAGSVIYITWNGTVPSVSADRFTETVYLGPGVTRARAVAVGADGLVSEWAETEYRLENIVDPVYFLDAAVEKAVRQTIGKPSGPLYTPDLWDIEELWGDEESDYQTLDDLRLMPKLELLALKGIGGKCDISVLPSLENLKILYLQSFGIDSPDLEIIGQCAGLEQLHLRYNKIGPVKALEGLEKLTVLDLSYNSILDAAPLGRLTELRQLLLTQNAVQDVQWLSSLTGLDTLTLDENLITSLSGLEKLTGLRSLEISFNPALISIDEVASLRSLVQLSASRCQIEKLPDLSRLTALENAELTHNMLTDLDGLRGLPALRILSVSDNAIASLDPLSGCSALEILDVSRNAIGSVEPLRGLPALTELNAEHNLLRTLAPLKDCPALNAVLAYGNNISDPLNTFNGTRLEGKVQW
jgi:Leucine-rich repeat (LRR) protein